MFLLNKVPWK